MTNVVIDEDGSGQVAYYLMYLDQNAAGTLRVKGGRLDMRVDLGPLLRPVGADFLVTAGEAAFERLRPSYVRGHGGEGSVDVSRVECCVRRAEQLNLRGWLVWHQRFPWILVFAAELVIRSTGASLFITVAGHTISVRRTVY
jgi:hypothetical protein